MRIATDSASATVSSCALRGAYIFDISKVGRANKSSTAMRRFTSPCSCE
jgi:hypothetical protein